MENNFNEDLSSDSSESNDLGKHEYFIKYFRSCKNILDLGCGDGNFMKVCENNGINVLGVDISREKIAACQAKGLKNLHLGTLQTYYAACGDSLSFDGIYANSVVEHMTGEEFVGVLEICSNILTRGGYFVIVTPNFQSHKVVTDMFWRDLTHIRPYSRRVLESYLEQYGFRIIEYKFSESGATSLRDRLMRIIRRLLLGKKAFDFFHRQWLDQIVIARRL